MMPEEDIIALIVEGDSAAAAKLRLVMKHGAEHAPYRHTQPRGEVIEDHLKI